MASTIKVDQIEGSTGSTNITFKVPVPATSQVLVSATTISPLT